MDRLSMGEKIAGASALLLFVFMFFDWFSVEASGGSGGFLASVTASGNAWDALDNIPIFLVIAIAFTVAVVGIRLADAAFEPTISLNAVVAVAGAISVLLILYRIVDPPGGGDEVPGLSVDVSPSLGIFLGLIAAAGIAYGGYRAMQEEGASFADVGDRLSGGGSGSAGGPGTNPPPPPPPSSPPPPPPTGGPQ